MRSTNNADDTFLYECGTLIAYIEGGGGPAPVALDHDGLTFQRITTQRRITV
jgi:hypothetical protein